MKNAYGQVIYVITENNNADFCRSTGTWTVNASNSDMPFMVIERSNSCKCCCSYEGHVQISLFGTPLGRMNQTKLFPLPKFDILNAAGDMILQIKMSHTPTIDQRTSECRVSFYILEAYRTCFYVFCEKRIKFYDFFFFGPSEFCVTII